MDQPRIYAIIAAKNEEKTIEDIVRRTKKFVNEVIVVNDGSTDLTVIKAASGGAEVISHPVNFGKGAAIRSGWLYTLWTKSLNLDDIIIMLDSDGQHNPEDIPKFVEEIKDYDMIVGKRNISKYPLYKKIGNKGLSILASMLAGQKIEDGECGFRCMRYSLLLDLLKVINAQRYELEMEINVVAGQMKHKIGFIGIESPFYRKGVSFMSGIKNGWSGVKTWLKIKTGWLKW